jgi:peptidoglycan/LPS O-acetylase OafA/YrhL
MSEIVAKAMKGNTASGATSSRSIPSLDGLRAASVALVIFCHYLDRLTGPTGRWLATELNWIGSAGVDVFFVISGFLITHLLLKELDASGRISLKGFYFRRFFRIFPPFYVYLTAVAILWATGAIAQSGWSFASAATYTFNYFPKISDWFVVHSWSLSLEEQFYLLWPPFLAMLGRKKSTYVALGVIALSPVSRLATYWLAPSMRSIEWMMLHTRLDTIMFGCVMALLWNEIRASRFVERLLHPAVAATAALYVAFVSPVLTVEIGGKYDWTIGYTLRALLVSYVLVYSVTRHSSPAGRLLNSGPIRHIGVMSYSLYLWQQIFTGFHSIPLPLSVLGAFAFAEMSYRFVELPSLSLRDRLGLRLGLFQAKAGRTNAEATASPAESDSQLELVESAK